jgi:hypothetical protein
VIIALVSVSTKSGVLQADTDSVAILLEQAGVPAHLAIAGDTIADEGFQAYSDCLPASGLETPVSQRQAFNVLIQRHFGASHARARALDALSRDLNEEQIQAVAAFFNSELGQRIIEAERAPEAQSEGVFEAEMQSYLNSEHWDLSRNQLIARLTKATRAIRFVNTLHAEISVAVKVSSLCQSTAEIFDAQISELQQLRADTRLVEPFMALELNPVIGAIFRNFSDKDLNDYLEFALGNTGSAFFEAMVQSARHGIAGGLAGLRRDLAG